MAGKVQKKQEQFVSKELGGSSCAASWGAMDHLACRILCPLFVSLAIIVQYNFDLSLMAAIPA